MRDIINATLGNDHFLKCSTYSIARNGEGLTPCLSIAIPENLTKYWAYIDFKKANGEPFKTPRIDVADGKIEYNIPHAVLDNEGKLEVQVIFQNENNEIWKSYVKEFVVRYSINATDDIPDKEDFITEAQILLDEAVETAKSVEERANNGEFKGDKGDKGDAGVVKFKPVTELPTENIDESAIYLVPSNVAQDNNTFDEYVYIDGAWEKIGSASVEVNLDEYVKKTDYATLEKAGVVYLPNWSGIETTSIGGINLKDASNSDIDKRDNYKALKSANLDYALKVGLTTNTETLTEEEKASACEWLGATRKLEVINTITTTEDTKNITVNTDTSGNAFELEELFVTVEIPTQIETSTTFYLYFNKRNNIFSGVNGYANFTLSWKSDRGIGDFKRYQYSNKELKTENVFFTEDGVTATEFAIKVFGENEIIPTGTRVTVRGIRK